MAEYNIRDLAAKFGEMNLEKREVNVKTLTKEVVSQPRAQPEGLVFGDEGKPVVFVGSNGN